MGITIHYKGKLDKADNIGKMLFELADISKDLGWKYKMVDDAKQEVQGVIIQPHEKCEPFTVLLNKNLRLISFAALCLHETNDDKALSASIKTQYAPLHIHISVIKLLKYLKDKYISNLSVFDEGDYWESLDENILKEKMDFLASRIDLFGDILDAHQKEFEEARTREEVAYKIEKILKKYGFGSNKPSE